VNVADAALDHRRFWDAMDALGEADLRTVETELGRRMVTGFGLDLQGLVLDMTNFATFIDTGNTQAPIAQRGKAKQHRTDLRLVGLALVVTRDGGVPIISHAYPGDRPDVTQFSVVVDALVARYRGLTEQVESLSVVYDAGQNSHDNHAVIEASGIGFVGSLAPSDHPGLLAIGKSRFRVVDADRDGGLTAVDTTVTRPGRQAPGRAHPLPDAARRPGPWVRPDPWPRPRPDWRGCRPDWLVARCVVRGLPWRRRSPRSVSPAGSARSSPPPSPATSQPASG
jgi:hypothetical protein